MTQSKISKNRLNKEKAVETLGNLIKDAKSLYLTDYSGINVSTINELRNTFRDSNTKFTVVKNRIFKQVLKQKNLDIFKDVLKGQIALAISNTDEVIPAKIIAEFQKKYKEKLAVRGSFVDNNELSAEETSQLADIPSKAELLGNVMGQIANPGGTMLSILCAMEGKILGAIQALITKLENKE